MEFIFDLIFALVDNFSIEELLEKVLDKILEVNGENFGSFHLFLLEKRHRHLVFSVDEFLFSASCYVFLYFIQFKFALVHFAKQLKKECDSINYSYKKLYIAQSYSRKHNHWIKESKAFYSSNPCLIKA